MNTIVTPAGMLRYSIAAYCEARGPSQAMAVPCLSAERCPSAVQPRQPVRRRGPKRRGEWKIRRIPSAAATGVGGFGGLWGAASKAGGQTERTVQRVPDKKVEAKLSRRAAHIDKKRETALTNFDRIDCGALLDDLAKDIRLDGNEAQAEVCTAAARMVRDLVSRAVNTNAPNYLELQTRAVRGGAVPRLLLAAGDKTYSDEGRTVCFEALQILCFRHQVAITTVLAHNAPDIIAGEKARGLQIEPVP